MGAGLLLTGEHLRGLVQLVGQIVIDSFGLIRHPRHGPWREISASVFRVGAQALGITALVGFLIGVVLSYLSAEQLKAFGANVFIVNLLGMGIIREVGPVIAAVLVAGRSGSAITAQLGVMRVTEELDALSVMGIPHTVRLLLPKIVALAIAMPLLILWTSGVALTGGALAASVQLGITVHSFMNGLPAAVPAVNIWLAMGKGVVFGALIALVACHFGLRVQPNTESLGAGTTSSVVSSITAVIIADAVFAVIFSDVGFSLS
jgi:phospholipid/cholesterol/gamma-HCH transport system permease protein